MKVKVTATQGGGYVVRKYGAWVFAYKPPFGFRVGDPMPDEWGTAGSIYVDANDIPEYLR